MSIRWISDSTTFVRGVFQQLRRMGFRVRVERHAAQWHRVLVCDAAGTIIHDQHHLADARLAVLVSCEQLAEVCRLPFAYHPMGGSARG